jgi:hypothetical protein
MNKAISSRALVAWGSWRPESEMYDIRDIGLIAPARVVMLRQSGAQITCYGGPLDHRNPTAFKGQYDAEIAVMREP